MPRSNVTDRPVCGGACGQRRRTAALLSRWGTVLIAVSVLVSSCSGENGSPTRPQPSPVSFHVTGVPVQPQPGTSVQLRLTARLSDGTEVDVTTSAVWSTSDAAKATVTSGGLVTFHAEGTVIITGGYQNGGVAITLQVRSRRAPLLLRVVETAPTESKPVTGAVIEILEGADSGRQAVTGNDGSVAIEAASDSLRVRVTRTGYVTTEATVGPAAATIHLAPLPARVVQRRNFGPSSASGPTQERFVLPVHHAGEMVYRFQWIGQGSSQPAWVELRGRGQVIFERSSFDSITFEGTLRLERGVEYELKIYSRTAFRFLNLVVEHPS